MGEFELEPGEQVIANVRQHPFVLAMHLLPFFFLLFVPGILSGLYALLVSTSTASGAIFPDVLLPSGPARFLKGALYLFLWLGAFSTFTRYYLTVWTITSLRIVDIRQRGFFSREVSSFLLIRVQDVSTDVAGVFGTLIGFGHLNVETAGNAEKFSMNGIAHPERVRDIIMSQVASLHSADAPKSGL